MTTSNAIKTQGSTLQVGDAVPGTSPLSYLTVGDLQSISGPGGQAAEIDTTHLGSAAKEYLIGLPDNGEITLAGSFVESDVGQRELRTAREAQTSRDVKITLSDGVILAFVAFVRAFSINEQPDTKVDFSCTLRVTGAVTYTPAP